MDSLINFVKENLQNILIALVVIWILYYLVSKGINNDQPVNYANNWTNLELPKLIKEFGNPAVFDRKVGGLAIWTKDELEGTPFIRIKIRDEMVDFLYTWQKLAIPERLVTGLSKISDSISYDPMTQTVQVRHNSLATNIVTHWIIKKYASGELTIDEAVGKYAPMVMELLNEDPNGHKYRQLYSEI